MEKLEIMELTITGELDTDGEVRISLENSGIVNHMYITELQADEIAAHLLQVFGI